MGTPGGSWNDRGMASLHRELNKIRLTHQLPNKFSEGIGKGSARTSVRYVYRTARRILIVSVPVEYAAVSNFSESAPLFKEERYSCDLALVAYGHDPLFFHRPCAWATLAAYDHPIDVRQIELPQVFEKRLD